MGRQIESRCKQARFRDDLQIVLPKYGSKSFKRCFEFCNLLFLQKPAWKIYVKDQFLALNELDRD